MTGGKPVLYHVISRVVERRFAFEVKEKEKFRTLMRMQEQFTGCRVLSYCLMSNHFHVLLEVPPMPLGGFSDEALLLRLSAIYDEAFVAAVAKELADARSAVYPNLGRPGPGLGELGELSELGQLSAPKLGGDELGGDVGDCHDAQGEDLRRDGPALGSGGSGGRSSDSLNPIGSAHGGICPDAVECLGELEKLAKLDKIGGKTARMEAAVMAIHERFTYRMHDLGEFMKGLLQRFTQWFNRTHSRTGHLWEDRFKSLIVEDGVAARTISAYIDLNPVRAGIVEDPADYRWSSYGEAVGGGAKGNGKKAREGLVRAYFCDQGVGFEAGKWVEVSRVYRDLMGFALQRNPRAATRASEGSETLGDSKSPGFGHVAEILDGEAKGGALGALGDLGLAKMLRCRVRYFTDGVVIGSRDFVNEAFASARERFGIKRKDGARKMRGNAKAAAGVLWSARNLRKGVV